MAQQLITTLQYGNVQLGYTQSIPSAGLIGGGRMAYLLGLQNSVPPPGFPAVSPMSRYNKRPGFTTLGGVAMRIGPTCAIVPWNNPTWSGL